MKSMTRRGQLVQLCLTLLSHPVKRLPRFAGAPDHRWEGWLPVEVHGAQAVTHHISMLHPKLSPKVAHAIALALIYTTYVELVLDEEEIPQEIMDKVRSNDFKSFIDKTTDKRVN